MPDEIRLDGLGLAPGVLETIVTLAAQGVDGVASVGPGGLAGVMKKPGKGVEITIEPDERLSVTVHLQVEYGKPLRAVALAVQEAVGDAIRSQVGHELTSVDVFVDGIVFTE